MESIKVQILSHIPHVNQVLCGFHELGKNGECKVEFEDISEEAQRIYTDMSVVRVFYRGKVIVYDLLDGYIGLDRMRSLLEECDLYFKRSCSESQNRQFGELKSKIFPLGFNYHLTYKGSPLNDGPVKRFMKLFLRRESYDIFTRERFEGKPQYKEGDIKILFLTRLWDPAECTREETRSERERINSDRIALIRALKKTYGDNAVAGLSDLPISRSLAPELIMSGKYTKRKNYLKLLHKSDICIASTGLHGSIGWKTGEYVAAAKAIVSEPFCYSVTGEFLPEENYLEFTNPEECLKAVRTLASSPERLYRMKQNNYEYYNRYLSPKELVMRSLETADAIIDKECKN